MTIVFQTFRIASAIAMHPGEIAQLVRDPVAAKRAEMQEVVDFALDHLRANSPVGSGRDPHPGLYRDSHMLFVNGRNAADLSAWRPGDEIEISNPVPYARKIETGKISVSHPMVYELAEQAVSAKYGDTASIRFTYMPVRFGEIDSWSQSTKLSHIGHASRSTRYGWLVRQPALIIRSLRSING